MILTGARGALTMIDLLDYAEEIMLERRWLESLDGWSTVFIDYEPPFVERLWREVWVPTGKVRLNLHRIWPCKESERPLFHPHPWPSAMRVIGGWYEMAIGFGDNLPQHPPPQAARLMLGPKSTYEMTHQDAWHYVRPVDGFVYSVMVTGTPWKRAAHRPTKPLGPLGANAANEILHMIDVLYGPPG